MGDKWSDRDVSRLRSLATQASPRLSCAEIAGVMGRTAAATRNKLHVLGIKIYLPPSRAVERDAIVGGGPDDWDSVRGRMAYADRRFSEMLAGRRFEDMPGLR